MKQTLWPNENGNGYTEGLSKEEYERQIEELIKENEKLINILLEKEMLGK